MYNLRYEIVTPHLKFVYDNDKLIQFEYSVDEFDEDGNGTIDIVNQITEWNPFEDMIFDDREEGLEALMKLAEATHSVTQENRYEKDSYQRISNEYKFINGDFNFTARIFCDGRHGCFVDITRTDEVIEGITPTKRGVLINGNTDGYYSSFGSSSVIRVMKNGTWKFIDNFQQMEFTSFENAAKVICFLVGRSTSKIKEDEYIFDSHKGKVINVNESTNLFTGAFDSLCKYTPYTVTGIYLMEVDGVYHAYPVCESHYPIANAIVPKNHKELDKFTNIVSDKWHNIYQILRIYEDGTIVGTEISSQLYSVEISITRYPYSSLKTFIDVVHEYLGENYTVIECTKSVDDVITHRIWTVSNYEKKTIWNYMVTEDTHPNGEKVFNIKYIDSRNSALILG